MQAIAMSSFVENVKKIAKNRARYAKRREKEIEANRRRYHEDPRYRERTLRGQRAYSRTWKGKMKIEEFRKKNPEKVKAWQEVRTALQQGRLIKPDLCDKCGRKVPLEAHHEDYDKPLDVQWLCWKCHGTH